MPDALWTNSTTYDAQELRRATAMQVMTNGTARGGRSGIRPGTGGYDVTVSGTTITVTPGVMTVSGPSGEGVYVCPLDAAFTLTLAAAHATLPRIDLVYLRVWDTDLDGTGLRKSEPVYLAGTAASTPVAPTIPAGQTGVELATINVPASGGGAASVSQTIRPYTVAPGGILPSTLAPAATYVGMYWDDGAGLRRWNGTAWTYVQPLGIGQILFKYKTTDTPRSTATLTDDPHLTFSVAANAVYQVDGMLHWTTTDENQADLNIDWTIPTGATGTYLSFAQPTDGVTTQGPIRTMSTVIDAARTFGADSDTSNPSGMFFRAILITSSVGTYALQWARTGTAGTLTLLTNSWLSLTRVA